MGMRGQANAIEELSAMVSKTFLEIVEEAQKLKAHDWTPSVDVAAPWPEMTAEQREAAIRHAEEEVAKAGADQKKA